MRYKSTAAIVFLTVLTLACVMTAFVVSSSASAQDDAESNIRRVKLKTGKVFEGIVTETDAGIEIKMPAGLLVFPMSMVESIEDVVTPVQEYSQRKSKLDEKDAEGLCGLARWAFDTFPADMNVLKMAQADLEKALTIHEDYPRANALLRRVRAKIAFLENEANAAPAPKTPKTPSARTPRPVPAEGKVLDDYLLSDRDILWIRLIELRPTDKVIIKYVGDAQQRYIDMMRGRDVDDWDRADKEKEFKAMSKQKQVDEILYNMPENWDLLKDIHIRRNPKVIIDFRNKVWPTVSQYCASIACHGGPEPKGGLKFFPNVKTGKGLYTNFAILVGCKYRNRRLIDRQIPQDSLFLQYGLKPKVARFKHPKVNNADIPVIFSSVKTPIYRRIIEWIRGLQGPMAPDYRLDYTPPFGMKLYLSGKPDLPAVMNVDVAPTGTETIDAVSEENEDAAEDSGK